MIWIAAGAGDRVVIEAEVEEPIKPEWIFGHFRMRFPHATVGDWDDVVTLRAVGGAWQKFVHVDRQRWDKRLAGLESEQLFELLATAAYGDDCSEPEIADAFSRFHVNDLGLSALDPYIVLLVEPPGEGQRLLWRDVSSDGPVQEARLPEGTLQLVGAEFVARLQSATGWRPPRIPRSR